MASLSARLSLLLEAATGGFYVSITRGFLIVMLSYAGYNLKLLSLLFLLQAVLSVVVCIVMYYRPIARAGNNARLHKLTVFFHILERILWMCLPILVPFKTLEIILSCAAMVCTTPVGVLLNYLVYSQFRGAEAVDVVSKRFAFGSASSIVGSILGMAMIWAVHSYLVYIILYLLAGAVGLVGSVAVFLMHYAPREELWEQPQPLIEVEIRKVNAFLFLILYCASINILYIMWIPFLKSIGASQTVAASLAVLGPVGTIVGSILWRTPTRCRLAMLLLVFSIVPILLVRSVPVQLVLYLLFSIASISGFLMSALVYSTYTKEIGVFKVSILSQLGYEAGVAIASMLVLVITAFTELYIATLILAGLSMFVAYVAIPEFSILPERVAVYYARIVYSASITSLTYTVLITREAAYLFMRALAITFLITFIYLLYHLLAILLVI